MSYPLPEMSDDAFKRMNGKFNRDDATRKCPICYVILMPRQFANGYVPRQCSCEITARIEHDKRTGRASFARAGSSSGIPLPVSMHKTMNAKATEAEATWTCEKCGVQKPQVFANCFVPNRCACVLALIEEQKREQNREEQRRFELERRKKSCAKCYTWLNESPGNLKKCRFDNYADGYFPEAVESMKAFVDAYQPGNPRKKVRNRLLWGSAGTGKTHLMAAAANQLIEWNVTCRWMSAEGFFKYLGSCFEKKVDTDPVIDTACTVEVLFIDDIDKVYLKQLVIDKNDIEAGEDRYQIKKFFAILDERYKNNLPTIISSNKEDLTPYVGRYGHSRFTERLQTIKMIGDDYRPVKLLMDGDSEEWV